MNDIQNHRHHFELMVRTNEDAIREPNTIASGSLEVYALCNCGRTLDRDEIEFRINDSARNQNWKDQT